jgi:hypothetical protein
VSCCWAPIWSPLPDFCFLFDNCGFLAVGRPLWREDGFIIYSYNCFWALPEQSFWGPSPAELRPYFTVSFETLPPGGPGPHIYIPQKQGGPVIPPGTGLCYRKANEHDITDSVRTPQESGAVYCENHTERTAPVRASQETVAVYCENQTEHTNPALTSQETVSVYCENLTEHTNPVLTSQETVAVYCENHAECRAFICDPEVSRAKSRGSRDSCLICRQALGTNLNHASFLVQFATAYECWLPALLHCAQGWR